MVYDVQEKISIFVIVSHKIYRKIYEFSIKQLLYCQDLSLKSEKGIFCFAVSTDLHKYRYAEYYKTVKSVSLREILLFLCELVC